MVNSVAANKRGSAEILDEGGSPRSSGARDQFWLHFCASTLFLTSSNYFLHTKLFLTHREKRLTKNRTKNTDKVTVDVGYRSGIILWSMRMHPTRSGSVDLLIDFRSVLSRCVPLMLRTSNENMRSASIFNLIS